MKPKEKTNQKVEEIMHHLNHPPFYGGTDQLDERILKTIQQENSLIISPYVQNIAGWAAIVMLLINISLFVYKDLSVSAESQDIDFFLENYSLTSSSDWQTYFTVDELETTFANEK
ncbi:hypothetical protein ACT29H_06345 [Thermophagus sp. OGC60D27]|uniref:hypothetical protein n=1 Tax=Thermophagus sp. OGC60D27 TaxID=3458415 RepID=UPI0040384474